ncbi:MAG TPA: molybdate ABC transporter substrate-binding protein [Terriglobales bacterium]|nr:molybdate ABC transporter substrate-binding protein [Terriglobales bacterium]
MRTRSHIQVLRIVVFLAALASPAWCQELTVAAAADVRPALDQIAARFEAETGIHVHLIYGSSGNFYQQIQNGAPFDLFFSANTDYARRLDAAGLTVPQSYYEYSRGKIVLLVPAQSRLDLKKGVSVLLDPAVKKIAIADPKHAPYGQAAVAALMTQNVYDKVSSKLVTGENISQTASFVQSGAADIGIVALSLALSVPDPAQVRFQEIPEGSYPEITQACVALKSSKNQTAAMRLESYVKGGDAGRIFQRFGFVVPSNNPVRRDRKGPHANR